MTSSESPRHSVLIAEDDPGVRLMLEFVLGSEGYEVLVADDGEKALSLALGKRPDVVVLDHHMPKLSGRDVLAALRRDDATKSIPVLILSGSAGAPQDWDGAHYLGKPFDPDELVDCIRAVLPTIT
jgi:DNA-binding response OmpR family regulator